MPRLLKAPARQPDEPLEQRHRDMAASLQARLEEVYLGMLKKLAAKTGAKAVCLAGGVAFNCVANGKIFDSTPFEHVYVHPAAGDAGLAVGAAYYVWHQILGKPRSFVMKHAYWGPGYSQRGNAVRSASKPGFPRRPHRFRIAGRRTDAANRRHHRRRENSRLVSGPRGVGTTRARQSQHRRRSAPPGNERNSQSAASSTAKSSARLLRPSWRKKRASGFEKSHPSPFMTLAYSVLPEKRDKIPAPTHVDGTGRLQTVTARPIRVTTR